MIEWRKEIHELLTKLNFRQSKNDPCLYIRHQNGKTMYIGTWVDDTLIVTNDEGIEKFKNDCEEAGYNISFFGYVEKFLGIAQKSLEKKI